MRYLWITGLLLLAAVTAFTGVGTLQVSSPAFGNKGAIPAKYSCEGEEVSPPINVSGIPAGARSLALTMHDPYAPKKGGVTHWVVWNIDTGGANPENFKGASQGFNSDNKTGYKGMCPPSGTHRYNFVVYALDTNLQLPGNATKAALESAIRGHILAQGELTGLYSKR